MKNLKNSILKGEVSIPSSKSHVHRLLFSALLKKSISFLKIEKNSFLIDDIQATLNVLKTVGCKIIYDEIEETLQIDSQKLKYDNEIIDCYESGTTLRISIIIMLFLFKEAKITGSKKLMTRPLKFYEDLFQTNNIKFKIVNNVLHIKGNIGYIFQENELKIEDCPSSQFITALMFVIPYYKKEYTLHFNDMESVYYLEVTKKILLKFNITYNFEYDSKKNLKKITYIPSSTKEIYKNNDLMFPEIDYSSLAYWLVANALGSNIKIKNKIYSIEEKFIHPDQEIINILNTSPSTISLKHTPDLLPIILVWASLQNKITTNIINFERNRLKESNRVEGMINQLKQIGAKIKLEHNLIQVYGIEHLNGGEIDSLNDHRIVMSFAIAALKTKGQLKIKNPGVVKKSYYNFWNDYKNLGGKIE